MPYIISTTTRVKSDSRSMETRRAVATLGRARDECVDLIRDLIDPEEIRKRDPGWTLGLVWAEVDGLPESGGTIGPLPDGTVIEVRHAEWGDLLSALELADYRNLKNVGVLDAFNAR